MTTMTSMQNHQPTTGMPPMTDRPPTNRKVVFVVRERMTDHGPKSYWTRVGAAFENRDGSLSVKLDALPMDGQLQIREDDGLNRRPPVNAPF